jgi:hypothetical protein
MSKWFAATRLALCLDKTIIIKFRRNNSPWYALHIGNNRKHIEKSVNMQFLL